MNHLFVITAASGAGKTSLVQALLKSDENLCFSVSHTTRQPRASERNGMDYHFVSEHEFVAMLERGEFLENAAVHGARYGTSRQAVEVELSKKRDVLFEIDWQGARELKRLYPHAVTVFVLPPSVAVLAQRLELRGQDSAAVIAQRIAVAREEMRHVSEFDYVIINTHFDEALADIGAIVRATRLRYDHQCTRHAVLIGELT